MKVLLVEDDQRLATSLRHGLEAEGFSVDTVHDGLDGLWRAREGIYAAIVLDIMLGGMNGYEICRTLRSEDNWVPILMLTAKDGEYDEADGLDLGADDYLRKPCSLVVLVARLHTLMRRAQAQPAMDLQVGNLSLNPNTRRCRRGDVEIELTARELLVLHTLMNRAPDVVPKQELLHAVWGFDFKGDPNIVEVYIGYLRRKIDRPFDTRSIRTVRGVGYQLTR
ncbi:MAG: response regulator transcription factor [Acidimicrobiia bacterium]|nr:response regulator transcription factor [Acidimicrobiia bacterium]MCY4456899.1 response regulator transcription factor [Acidimicrobiaceae bacterium]